MMKRSQPGRELGLLTPHEHRSHRSYDNDDAGFPMIATGNTSLRDTFITLKVSYPPLLFACLRLQIGRRLGTPTVKRQLPPLKPNKHSKKPADAEMSMQRGGVELPDIWGTFGSVTRTGARGERGLQ